MCPICLDTPVCLGIPMFGCLLYVGHSHMFGCPPCLDALMYVWKMFGCMLYIYNTKKTCFVRLRGFPYAPYTFGWPHMFGSPLYLWTPTYIWTLSICSDIPHTFGCPSYIWGHPNIQSESNMESIQTYRRLSKYVGHPTIKRDVQTWGAPKHTGGI